MQIRPEDFLLAAALALGLISALLLLPRRRVGTARHAPASPVLASAIILGLAAVAVLLPGQVLRAAMLTAGMLIFLLPWIAFARRRRQRANGTSDLRES